MFSGLTMIQNLLFCSLMNDAAMTWATDSVSGTGGEDSFAVSARETARKLANIMEGIHALQQRCRVFEQALAAATRENAELVAENARLRGDS